MTAPKPPYDPDDPLLKGKTWDLVEMELDKRDAAKLGMTGYDFSTEVDKHGHIALSKPVGFSWEPAPWELSVNGFSTPATCNLGNWKHAAYLKAKIGTGVLTLTMARGNNAIDQDMLTALQDAIMDLQSRQDIRIVVLRAEGKLFCGGLDPKLLMEEGNKSDSEIEAFQLQLARVLYFLSTLPQFTVALCQGSAMGVGVGLLSACDLVVSTKAAYFQMADTKLGLVPTVSIPHIMRKVVCSSHQKQLLVLCASLPAATAMEYGIVSEVVEDAAALDVELGRLTQQMTVCAPGAVACGKKLVMETYGHPLSQFLLNHIAATLTTVRSGPEFAAGIEAIQAKARPPWARAPLAE